MKSRISFYALIIVLTVVDAFLISNPNLLGKLGFVIYKFSYLRTFPRALLTVSIVVGVVFIVTQSILWLNKKEWVVKKLSISVLSILLVMFILVWLKTAYDFQSWSYGHSGHKLKYGAYLLPFILILVTASGLFQVFKSKPGFSEPPLNKT
jgi:hypothetical protein